jgi:hypothetical protein
VGSRIKTGNLKPEEGTSKKETNRLWAQTTKAIFVI